MEKLLSASEIAALKLPGMPTTKAAIIQKARRENWRSEERTGLGGTRRAYEVPAQYQQMRTAPAGTEKINLHRLELAMKNLNAWEAERGVKVDENSRPAVIAVLYDYLQHEGGKDASLALKAPL